MEQAGIVYLMKKTSLFFILMFLLPASCFAQTNSSESITITTYYPSPAGVYRSVRLYPTDEPTDNIGAGVMYYNRTENVIKFYNGSTWSNVAGGDGGGYLAQQTMSGDIYFSNASSNVGIGTTNPTQKLDVNGNIFTSGNFLAVGNITASGNLSTSGNLTVARNIRVLGDVCLANGVCLSQLSFNGVCGSLSKTYPATSTSYGGDSFCGSGTPSPAVPAFPAQGGSVSWTCPAINGNPISCSASRDAAVVNGVCGSAATAYGYSDTALFGVLCSAGIPNPANPAFPDAGNSSSWSCAGANGGTSSACTASRSRPPLVGFVHSEEACTFAGGEVVPTGLGSNQCRFNGASCPSGWQKYLTWSAWAGGTGINAAGDATYTCGSYAWGQWASAPRCPHLCSFGNCLSQFDWQLATQTKIGCY
jgi:hypothetical protein